MSERNPTTIYVLVYVDRTMTRANSLTDSQRDIQILGAFPTYNAAQQYIPIIDPLRTRRRRLVIHPVNFHSTPNRTSQR